MSQEPDGLDCNFRHPFGERNEDPNDTSPQSEPGVAVLAKNLPKEPKEPEKEWGELGESKAPRVLLEVGSDALLSETDAMDNEQIKYREGIPGPMGKVEGGQLELLRIEMADKDVKAERKGLNSWFKKNKKEIEVRRTANPYAKCEPTD